MLTDRRTTPIEDSSLGGDAVVDFFLFATFPSSETWTLQPPGFRVGAHVTHTDLPLKSITKVLARFSKLLQDVPSFREIVQAHGEVC